MVLKWITDSLKKSEAAAIIQRALDVQVETGVTTTVLENSGALSLQLVDNAWTHLPELCGGSVAGRPHKLALAAFALGRRIDQLPIEDPLRNRLTIALGTLLHGATRDGSPFSFNTVDTFLIGLANRHFVDANSGVAKGLVAYKLARARKPPTGGSGQSSF